jgi:hypothetical protein
MKTSIQNLIAATFALVVLSTSAFAAADGKENNVTVLSHVANINKVVAIGNVEVILIQAYTESVKVYDNYYAKNALVQQENGVLRISSFQKEKLTVAVYVRNLTSIEADDNANVKTLGKINSLALSVVLKGKATADLNANTVSLFTEVQDTATLTLSGEATDYFARLSTAAKINLDQFKAEESSMKTVSTIVIAKVPVKKQQLTDIVSEPEFTVLSK